MPTPRQPSRPAKSRTIASQPAAQQSSAQSMAGERENDDVDRQRNALENQGAQGRHPPLTLREEEDDDTATRH